MEELRYCYPARVSKSWYTCTRLITSLHRNYVYTLVLAIDFCNIWSDYQQAEFKMLCNLVGLHGWNSCNWTVQAHCKLQYSKCHMIMREDEIQENL